MVQVKKYGSLERAWRLKLASRVVLTDSRNCRMWVYDSRLFFGGRNDSRRQAMREQIRAALSAGWTVTIFKK
jgi:hypothetical protein